MGRKTCGGRRPLFGHGAAEEVEDGLHVLPEVLLGPGVTKEVRRVVGGHDGNAFPLPEVPTETCDGCGGLQQPVSRNFDRRVTISVRYHRSQRFLHKKTENLKAQPFIKRGKQT